MSARQVPIGKVSGLLGVAGWVKIHSYTRPRWNAAAYSGWRVTLREEPPESAVLESSRRRGDGVIAKFRGIDDRTAAAVLVGREITVEETSLAPLPPGEYYWFQLIGLEVVSTVGERLGRVERLLETGANDVLVVEGAGARHLIPYVSGDYVKGVDLDEMRIEVEWRAEWRA